MSKLIAFTFFVVSLSSCSPGKEVVADMSEPKVEFRISELHAVQLLNEYLDFYREMPMNELIDKFGIETSIIRPISQKETIYYYDIMIIVDWENQENRNVSVDAFLTESNKNDVDGSKTIAQETIVRSN